MDRIQAMTVFIAVAEAQGFAAAARRLQLSAPGVTRAIAELESHLGVKLLDRTTRWVRTTEAGQRYLEDARKIITDIKTAEDAIAGVNAEPGGHLAVTAPVMFGKMFVMPHIVEYLSRYTQTEISTVFVDRVVSLIEEGLDVAIRIGELPDSSLRAIRVGSVRHVVCAAPEYLKNNDLPDSPEALKQHELIVTSAGDGNYTWQFNNSYKLRPKPRLTVTTNDAAIEAASSGFGITRLLSYQVCPQIIAGDLQTILDEYEPDPIPIHIVHREGRLSTTRTRAFIDFLADRLRADDFLNG